MAKIDLSTVCPESNFLPSWASPPELYRIQLPIRIGPHPKLSRIRIHGNAGPRQAPADVSVLSTSARVPGQQGHFLFERSRPLAGARLVTHPNFPSLFIGNLTTT
jgi:hypothetical protein